MGVALIRSKNVLDLRFSTNGLARISDDAADALRGVSVEAGDVLLNITGQSVARCCRAPESILPARVNQHVAIVRPDPAKLDSRFLQYTLVVNKPKLLALASAGATREALTKAMISEFEIDVPEIEEQQRISAVIGSLDDKIDSNQRLAATLDEIAGTLFKARFVDFLPYDDLVDSEIGPIPVGWQVDKLGNRAVTMLGGTPSRKRPDYWADGTVPWINSGKVNEFRILEPAALITQEALDKSAAKLMPAGTTVLAITGATLGQVSRLEIDASANQSVIGVLGSERLPDDYLFYWIRLHITDLVSRQTGAAQQHINKGDVDDLRILLPPQDVLSEFCQQAGPLLRQIAAAQFESQYLEGIRNALLPRLISGDVTVAQDSAPIARAA
jgi:type I restriction enzyme S subunit